MTPRPDRAVLRRLGGSGQTVSDPAEDVRGRRVKDKDGNGLGKVDDLLIDDQERKVRLLLVDHDGFLGIGRTKSFIPVEAIARITDYEVHINHPREQVADAPGYDPDVGDHPIDHYGGIHGHYGYAPGQPGGRLRPDS